MRGPMRALRRFARTASFAGALLLCGCPGKPCPTMPIRQAGTALDYLRSMRSHVHSMRAEASVDQRGAHGRIRGRIDMFVERPDHVRFDAMTQFGPAATLTSDGRAFALNDIRESRYLTGPTCPANIARLLGIPMSGEDVARFLFGDTPLIDAQDRSVRCTGDGTYLVTLRASDGRRQEVEIDVRDADRRSPPAEQRLRLVRSELFDAHGHSLWRVELDDYRVLTDPRSQATPKLGVAMPFKSTSPTRPTTPTSWSASTAST